jgi:hypothetical protein
MCWSAKMFSFRAYGEGERQGKDGPPSKAGHSESHTAKRGQLSRINTLLSNIYVIKYLVAWKEERAASGTRGGLIID